ncbi:MAG: hypothetical protein WA633_09520 [Stellaceae bacterium]
MRLDQSSEGNTLDWQHEIFAVLKAAEMRQVGYFPDAGHARLIELCRADPAIRSVPLTSEEEGIGLLAGAWLGGERGVLLIAVERRRQLHQYAVDDQNLPLPIDHAGGYAGRMG